MVTAETISETISYEGRQRLRPQRRVIAISARLAEYQQLYGHSAIRLLNRLEADVANEPVAWRRHRVDAFKTIMSGYTTLAEIRGDEAGPWLSTRRPYLTITQ